MKLIRNILLVVGALLGWFVYGISVRWAHEDARDAIVNARPFPDLLLVDPTLEAPPCVDGKTAPTLGEHEVVRLLQILALAPRDRTDLQSLGTISKTFGLRGTGTAIERCTPGVQFLVHLALESGKNDHASLDRATIESDTATLLASWLADVPGSHRAYQECLKDRQHPACTAALKLDGASLFTASWPLRSEAWGPVADPSRVVSELFQQTKVPASYQSASVWRDPERGEEREILIGLAKNVLVGILRVEEVRLARAWISIVRGPEQCLMALFFFGALGCYAARAWARHKNVTELAEYTVVEDWLVASLPALGFIGTVRSLSAALAKADTIVSSTSSVEQAGAISDVASTLALAFTTTLVALILGMIVTLIQSLLVAWEKAPLPTPTPAPASAEVRK